jgi:hypothetical protein
MPLMKQELIGGQSLDSEGAQAIEREVPFVQRYDRVNLTVNRSG